MTKRKKPEDLKKRGRKPFFDSPEKLEKHINEYFTNCPDKRTVVSNGEILKVPCPTVTGLALYLGFIDRRSLYEYNEKPEFTHIIKRARTFIENEYEKMLQNPQCTGAIFALKVMGWNEKSKDEQEIDNLSKQSYLKAFGVND